MESLVIWGGIALLTVFLGGETLLLAVTGNLKWDPYVSRMTKGLWTGGFALAVVLAVVFFGPALALTAWPVWIGLPVGTFAVFGLLDALCLPKSKPERTVTFADGRRAKVDGKRKPFELL
jgi:hypothetical protein